MIVWPQMSSKRATLLLLFLLLPALSGSALAQSGKDKTSTPAPTRLEELRAKGSEALFNLDYDSARQTFMEMTRLFPDDPTGSQMQASTRWLETLNKSRLLQAAIYSTQSFYTGTEDKPDRGNQARSKLSRRRTFHWFVRLHRWHVAVGSEVSSQHRRSAWLEEARY